MECPEVFSDNGNLVCLLLTNNATMAKFAHTVKLNYVFVEENSKLFDSGHITKLTQEGF